MLSRHDCGGQARYQAAGLRESVVSGKGQLEERKGVLGEFIFPAPFLLVLCPSVWGLLAAQGCPSEPGTASYIVGCYTAHMYP